MQSEEIFQTIPEWAQFSQGQRRKKQKTMWHWPESLHENLVPLLTYLSFHLILAKILKAFLKTLPTKTKPTKCPAREKKIREEKRKKGGGEKAKSKSQDCCVTFKPKTILKFYFLCMPELRKLIFCIWIRNLRSVRPVNQFVVSFSSLLIIERQWPENHSTSFQTRFSAKSPGANGLKDCYILCSSTV